MDIPPTLQVAAATAQCGCGHSGERINPTLRMLLLFFHFFRHCHCHRALPSPDAEHRNWSITEFHHELIDFPLLNGFILPLFLVLDSKATEHQMNCRRRSDDDQLINHLPMLIHLHHRLFTSFTPRISFLPSLPPFPQHSLLFTAINHQNCKKLPTEPEFRTNVKGPPTPPPPPVHRI